MRPIRKLLLGVGGLIVIGVGAFLVWFFLIKADPKPPLGTKDLNQAIAGKKKTTGTTKTGATLDGVWTISSDSTVGYRIKETIAGLPDDAVGRSSVATGTLTIASGRATAATFSVEVATIKSDSGLRDSRLPGLMGTATFPTATFKLTSPIGLGTVPADGVTATFTATGDLTLHGTTKSVTFPLEAKVTSGRIGVLGNIKVTFADYGVANPSNAITTVGDTGTLEFVLVFDHN
jgi:YceI-like domain.